MNGVARLDVRAYVQRRGHPDAKLVGLDDVGAGRAWHRIVFTHDVGFREWELRKINRIGASCIPASSARQWPHTPEDLGPSGRGTAFRLERQSASRIRRSRA